MSPQRPDDAEAEVSRMLRQASSDYGDLPEQVGDRLDRVLDTLPPADTLHARGRGNAFESWAERFAERLRPKRVRYAIASAAAAVLVTVGGVATAIQLTTGASQSDSGASSSEVLAEDQTDREGEAEGATGDPGPAESEGPQNESGEDEAGVDGLAGIETFATGSDYGEGTDLVAVLRELGADSASGEVPPELADLAAGGDFWQRCEEAIAERYEGLLVAVDFARFETRPAIMALMVGDDGDIAVALTPACADGVIEPLAEQA
ncbi:hypothetical protein O1R50_16575 [Glycomyces luteolus]|uniref:Uncharacterized protein n=1 Tax=Glycomyces luteolus TaxID=2670330 RepID=A0A9X3PCH8_9ACTN|nr:hypothetical protein [Glycomyces luteolus]MDA1361247.1 hypothetical protein [Glycomyces luteolus]